MKISAINNSQKELKNTMAYMAKLVSIYSDFTIKIRTDSETNALAIFSQKYENPICYITPVSSSNFAFKIWTNNYVYKNGVLTEESIKFNTYEGECWDKLIHKLIDTLNRLDKELWDYSMADCFSESEED